MANLSSITFQNDTSLSLDKDGQFRVGGDGELEVAPGTVAPATHATSHGSLGADPLTLAQSQITNLTTDLAGKFPYTGGTLTGGVTIGNGGNLTLSGGDAIGEGNIVMTAAPSSFWDANLLMTDSTAKTLGFVCGSTPAFAGAAGAFLGFRGNTFTHQPGQRGIAFMYAGKPATPGANEGMLMLGTNDTPRLTIDYWGVTRVLTSLALGGGTALTKAVVYTPTLAPASQGANTLVEQTFTVAGLTTADTVTVNAPGAVACSARVIAADTLALTFHAPSGGTYTAPAGVYRIIAWRS